MKLHYHFHPGGCEIHIESPERHCVVALTAPHLSALEGESIAKNIVLAANFHEKQKAELRDCLQFVTNRPENWAIQMADRLRALLAEIEAQETAVTP